MILPFTAALPIILSLLTTQSMAQICRSGIVDNNTKSFSRKGICPPSKKDKDVYLCGSSGASITVKGTQITAHGGSVDSSMIITCDGREIFYGCRSGATGTFDYSGCARGVQMVRSVKEHS
ncbi:hypothetical protein Vi05172_g4727 [Venturia inaequalis]|nr:hypothetical protein Vi05172_g4727 [Venturia inaequalis]